MDAALETARAALNDGLVVGVPTDTVYGLAVDAYRREGLARLFEAKQRAPDRAIPILMASVDQADAIALVSDEVRRLAAEHWPGPLTLIVPRRRGLPEWIGDPTAETVGLRVPDHQAVRSLAEIAGPLAATSANKSGEEPAMDATSAEAIFGEEVAYYVAGSAPGWIGSTVLDLTGAEPAVVRAGALPWPPE